LATKHPPPRTTPKPRPYPRRPDAMGPRKRAKRDAAEGVNPSNPPTPPTPSTAPSMPSPQPSDASQRSKQSGLSSQTPSIPINAPRTSSTSTPQGTPRHSLLGQSPSVMDGVATPKSVNQVRSQLSAVCPRLAATTPADMERSRYKARYTRSRAGMAPCHESRPLPSRLRGKQSWAAPSSQRRPLT
jgi:hypothetical protein